MDSLACVSGGDDAVHANRKVPWRLSSTRKANVRTRLKKVDAVIEAVRASGVECSALVCPLAPETARAAHI